VNVVITHVESVDKVIVQLEKASEAVLDLSAVTKEAAAGLCHILIGKILPKMTIFGQKLRFYACLSSKV